jgi:phage-related holin
MFMTTCICFYLAEDDIKMIAVMSFIGLKDKNKKDNMGSNPMPLS